MQPSNANGFMRSSTLLSSAPRFRTLWRALLGTRSAHNPAPAIGAAFFTLVHSGLLGALISLPPRPLYGWYYATELWGLGALEDQQLAGLLMWVPMGAVYFGACLALARRLVGAEEPHLPRLPRRSMPVLSSGTGIKQEVG